MKNSGDISDYYLFKWRGAVFDTIENSGDRIAGFTVQADTYEDLIKKHNKAVADIRVYDDRGVDMTRRDLLTSF